MKIDWWTLGLQAVNVLVLLWLLHRFLYQPVLRLLEQRRRLTAQVLEQAQAAQLQVRAERTTLEAERAELAASRQRAQTEAQAAVAAERDRLLAAVQAEAAERATAARTALAAERRNAETTLAEEASRLAADIARKLLQRLPQSAVLGAFLEGACAGLRRLPRGSVTAAGETIEVVIAAALSDAEEVQCREHLRAALGIETDARFVVDPALIAGIELRLPHAVVRNHWANDLAQVLETLHADAHAE